MAGRRYCPFEGEYVPMDKLESIDGTLVHMVDPMHRVSDGMTVHAENGRLRVDAAAAVEAMADAMPDDRQ